MNAEDFYEHFKDALKYLGVDWSDKDQVTIHVVDNKFVMSVAGKSCSLQIVTSNQG